MQPGRSKPTLKDIAQATGYSVNTVSRALRNLEDIGEGTRKKIQEYARSIGYHNNSLASSLRLGYSSTIAIIVPDVSNPNFSIMTKGIEETARKEGYAVFVLNTNEDDKLEEVAIRTALSKNVDGILLCPNQKTTRNVEFLKQTGIPFILVGRYFEEVETDYVISDDVLGGYLAAKFLIGLEHRRILTLLGPPYVSSSRERLQGYRNAHRELQVPVDEGLVYHVSATGDDCEQVLDGILKRRIEFTAIFAFSDMIAWRVWKHLGDRGIQIPGDCSLVGFDNIQSRIILPMQLDTVNTNKKQFAQKAMEILLEKMRGEIPMTRHIQYALNVRLVHKGTAVRRPPKK